MGTSQWLFDDRRKTSSSSGEYQSAGPGFDGSSGRSAPGMSFHRNIWNVRILAVSIGKREYTAIPNCPGKKPNPNASSGPPMKLSLLKSKPDGMPVFEGATNRWGYTIGSASP